MADQEISCDEMADADLKATLSQNMVSDIPPGIISEEKITPMDIDGCVAQDSQSEYNNDNLYVLNCKIHLVGSNASKMRELVNMVRRGGISGSLNDELLLTHIAVGTPSHLSLTVSSLKSSVFKGRSFCFSSNFPDVKRDGVFGWIREGGGKLVEVTEKDVDYTVEAHGVHRTQFNGVTNVSAHWIKCCKLDNRLLDVSSHILFSPIQCKVPLPGFGRRLFFISDVEKRTRDLLRNLINVLGGRLCCNLTKMVNYLVCESPQGSDYEKASALGVKIVKIDWILNYIYKNKLEIEVRSESQYGQIIGSSSLDSVCSVISPENKVTEKQVFTSDHPAEEPHSAFGLSKTSRSNEKEDITNPVGSENTGIYGGSGKSQAESQVVGYEEDLSGQMM